jgi:hypothetical protein
MARQTTTFFKAIYRIFSDLNNYEGDGKYFGDVPEVKILDPLWIKPLSSEERAGAMSACKLAGLTPKEWAKGISLHEPVDVSLYADGSLIMQDGHHRQYAAEILGVKLPVKLKSINAKKANIRLLIAGKKPAA